MGEAGSLARLYRGLRQRELMRGDRLGISVLEGRLAGTLDNAAASFGPNDGRDLEGAPPRRIAVAMALAVFSHPHLAQTFASDPRPAILIGPEVLQEALGLSAWELDDLREEVDRRAGTLLKQSTLVRWLESHVPAPRLFQLLFPGVNVDDPRVRFRGTHVVASGTSGLYQLGRAAKHLPSLRCFLTMR